MEQASGSRGFSEFLLGEGSRLLARNSWAAEFHQAAAHLAHRVLTGVPRPVEWRQGDRKGRSGKELQQQMGNTQKERPATDTVARAALIMTQPQFVYLIEADRNFAAPSISVDRFNRIKGEIGTQQIPRREGKSGDGDKDYAGGQGTVRPHPPQEDLGIIDLGGARAAPYVQ